MKVISSIPAIADLEIRIMPTKPIKSLTAAVRIDNDLIVLSNSTAYIAPCHWLKYIHEDPIPLDRQNIQTLTHVFGALKRSERITCEEYDTHIAEIIEAEQARYHNKQIDDLKSALVEHGIVLAYSQETSLNNKYLGRKNESTD